MGTEWQPITMILLVGFAMLVVLFLALTDTDFIRHKRRLDTSKRVGPNRRDQLAMQQGEWSLVALVDHAGRDKQYNLTTCEKGVVSVYTYDPQGKLINRHVIGKAH